MNELVTKLIQNIKLIFRPILINGFIYYEKGKVQHENWGDDINYYFLKEIVQKPMLMFNSVSLAIRLELKNYLVIGSTIDMLCKKNTEVWGAGIIDENKPLRIKPRKVHAVRGPLTRKKLIDQGVECPEVYGDPALLISRYYKPEFSKKYRYGFIPHRSNLDRIDDFTIDEVRLTEREDVLIIDLSKYNKWTDIVDQICSCENILSASLHGLILPEAYGIPNLWVEFGKPLIGGHFKFHDFFLSISRDRDFPYVIEDYKLTIKDVQKGLSSWQQGYINLQLLIESAPFPIKL